MVNQEQKSNDLSREKTNAILTNALKGGAELSLRQKGVEVTPENLLAEEEKISELLKERQGKPPYTTKTDQLSEG